MPIEVLMPALSPTMKEGNLAKWVKKEGDKITSGEVIAEIETDKATMEVEAVDEGKLGKILIKAGSQNVPVNQAIALILEDGEDVKSLKSYEVKNSSPANEDKTKGKLSAPEKVKDAPVPVKAPVSAIAPIPAPAASGDARVSASPVAKKIAEQNNIDLTNVRGTGPKGRVTKEDVMEFLARPTSSEVVVRSSDEITAIPNNNVRQVIATRLVESKQTIPHFYLSLDINIASLLDVRGQVNNVAARDEGGKPAYRISVNDLVIKATALALKKIPGANASWSDEAIIRYNNVDISVAVAIDDGLITPIVKNADQKSVTAISSEMKSLAAKAKAGTLAPEEFQGGGFSISNLGMYGIKQFNAIVNPPQGCILAVGSGEKRVIVDSKGELEVADIMTVTLSCDHRVVDGAVGAEFLQAFKYFIENPATLLL